MREVAEERAEEESRSPRVSWASGDPGDLSHYAQDLAAGIANSLNGSNMQQEDALAVAQNGGVSGSVSDDDDGMDADDGDTDLDDDMMDKISSSPSIEDGGYNLPPVWPRRVDSLHGPLLCCHSPSSPVVSEARSSSPYLDIPDHPPLQHPDQQWANNASSILPLDCRHHHLSGEYTGPIELDCDDDDDDDDDDDNNDRAAPFDVDNDDYDDYADELDCSSRNGGATDMQNQDRMAQPSDETQNMDEHEHDQEQAKWYSNRDSGLELKFEDFSVDCPSSLQPYHDDQAECDREPSPYDFVIPYAASGEDDDDTFPLADDSRFIDSGWGGECLQDSEDIDFEFVYALHTFVATVEGQANATKGDTMVLLDDSNSYWWLVRVVKDSSIGTTLPYTEGPGKGHNANLEAFRVLTSRTYRNPDGKTGSSKQAQERRCMSPCV